MSEYALGDWVTFERKLKRTSWRAPSDKGPWQVQHRAWVPVTFQHSIVGVIVGWRTLANGVFEPGTRPTSMWEDYEPASLRVTEYVKAYLVAYDERTNPCYVLPEHIRILESVS
jgi:hypothetical protein